MYAEQPRLEVGEHKVNERKMHFSYLRVATLRERTMLKITLPQSRVTTPIVRDHFGAGFDAGLCEAAQGLGRAVMDHGQAQPPRVDIASARNGGALVSKHIRLLREALADLDGPGHERFMVTTAALPASPATHPHLVQFDGMRSANLVLVGAHHTGPELVENLKGGLVPAQPKLPLELRCRHAWRQTRHEVRSPEPYGKRAVGALHDRGSRQGRVSLACAAPEHGGTGVETIGLAHGATMRAGEAIRPPELFHVGSARRVVREEALKVRETLGEGEA